MLQINIPNKRVFFRYKPYSLPPANKSLIGSDELEMNEENPDNVEPKRG